MHSLEFDIVEVLDGTDDILTTGVTDLTVASAGGDDILYSVTASGAVAAYRVTETGMVLVDDASLPSSGIAGIAPELQAVDVDGTLTLMATGGGAGGLWSVDSTAGGSLSGAVAVPGGLPSDLAECATVIRNGDTYLVGTRLGSEEPGLWKMNADGSFSEVVAPGAGVSHGAGITAFHAVDLNDKAYVLAAAGDTNALVFYKVESTGLNRKDVLGAEDGIGIATPTALDVVELGGVTYALMAAAGSSTITVAVVSSDGRLTLSDHVTDDLDTRFQGATVLETATVDGRVFVAAAGSDDGLSLFELLPNGRLLHHAALADSVTTTLDNIADIALTVSGDTLVITVASGSEPGLTMLSVAMPPAETLVMGGPGAELLTGGAEDDVLVDGAGEDTLEGGAGADTFVLDYDGAADTIADFEVGIDSLDLSNWAFLRSTGQLTVVERADGAEIWFCDERLIVQTASGEPLTAVQVEAMDLLSVDRMLPEWADAIADPAPEPDDPEDSGQGSSFADFQDCGNSHSEYSGKGGKDTIRGNDGNDTLFGNAHNDYLDGGDGDDSLHAGQGSDTVMGGNDDDIIEGKDGHDLLEGESGNDTLSGNNARDTLFGGSGDDSLKGGKGYDIVYGGSGNDFLSGGEGIDELYGGDGADHLEGGVSNDTMDGGAGDDVLLASQGSDSMVGGAGHDSMKGQDGHDTMQGGTGNDSLYGSAGRDTLDGGAGDDRLSGGSGADVFIFNGGVDTITDLDAADEVVVDRTVWAGTRDELLDTALIADDTLTLDLGMGDSLVFKNVTDIDMIADALSFG